MDIRAVTAADIARVLEIERACFTPPWTQRQLELQLGPGHVFLAAWDGGELAGYVGAQYVLDEGYISNVAVAPRCRRRGAASALLRELENRARALGLSFLTLEVRRGNAAARALYEKNGYKTVGCRKNYYQNPREDAILMTLELLQNEGA